MTNEARSMQIIRPERQQLRPAGTLEWVLQQTPSRPKSLFDLTIKIPPWKSRLMLDSEKWSEKGRTTRRKGGPSAIGHAAKTAGVVISAPVSVITSGQARHAASPDCKCHRHCGRMEHSGSTKDSFAAVARSGCSLMMRSTMPHLPSVHWIHAARLQVLLKRNRFSGERP